MGTCLTAWGHSAGAPSSGRRATSTSGSSSRRSSTLARATAFFDERIGFYDTQRPATVWEHVKLAYEHQESLRGPLGGYLAGTNGDWSDQHRLPDGERCW
jgi:hypothetical protein